MDAWGTQLGVDTMRAICRIARELEKANEKPVKTENENTRLIEKCMNEVDVDVSSDVMSELLMDVDWTTYKMFEGLASDYLNGNDDVRKGIDLATSALTGWNLSSIAQKIIDERDTRAMEDNKDEN